MLFNVVVEPEAAHLSPVFQNKLALAGMRPGAPNPSELETSSQGKLHGNFRLGLAAGGQNCVFKPIESSPLAMTPFKSLPASTLSNNSASRGAEFQPSRCPTDIGFVTESSAYLQEF